MKLRCLFLALACLVSVANAHPDVDADWKLIPLHHGMNSVNLDGAGLMATIVIARRDNFNAHSFLVTTIYSSLKTGEGEEPELRIIPVMREGNGANEELYLRTDGGADCVLHDFRLLADAAHQSTVLIIAARAFGETLADEQPVTFERFRLTRNSEGEVGAPALYFKFEKRWKSAKAYCDVGEAFQSELGIGEERTPAGH